MDVHCLATDKSMTDIRPEKMFRGAIIRDCVVKNVVDGKTLKASSGTAFSTKAKPPPPATRAYRTDANILLPDAKVLLNPLGWCPRPSGGWVARESGSPGTHNFYEPTEVRLFSVVASPPGPRKTRK